MLNKQTPGIEVASLATLAQRWGLSDDGAMGLLTELVMRIDEAQEKEKDWELFGALVVSIEVEAGAWTRVTKENTRMLFDRRLPGFTFVKIECPKVKAQAAEKDYERTMKAAQRSRADMGAMSAGKDQNGAKAADIEAMSSPRIPSLRTVLPPTPCEGGMVEGDGKPAEQQPILPPPTGSVLILGAIPEVPTGKNKSKPTREEKKRLPSPTTPDMDRIGSWFGHAPGKGWTMADAEAWEQVKGMVSEYDMVCLEWYYTEARKRYGARRYDRQRDNGFWLCRDKVTLLNKWVKQAEMAKDKKEALAHEGTDDLVD
jgi:hypothetical protein